MAESIFHATGSQLTVNDAKKAENTRDIMAFSVSFSVDNKNKTKIPYLTLT